MRHKTVAKGITLVSVIIITLNLFFAACWIGNLIRLVNCDFQAPWKGEIIHAIGLMPVVSVVTVWFDDK